MDICVSSNFERFLYAVGGAASARLAKWMADGERTGSLAGGAAADAAAKRPLNYHSTRRREAAVDPKVGKNTNLKIW